MADRGGKAGWARRTSKWPLAATTLFLLPLPTAAGIDRQIVVPAPPLAPDYAAVTTKREAAKLVRKHLLVKIHFFPVELGGPKAAINIGYVTPQAAASHAMLTEMLSEYGERGLIDRLEIVPVYKGASIIPSRIRMKASHSRGGKSFERTIEIWDCGFCAPLDPLPDPDAPGEVVA